LISSKSGVGGAGVVGLVTTTPSKVGMEVVGARDVGLEVVGNVVGDPTGAGVGLTLGGGGGDVGAFEHNGINTNSGMSSAVLQVSAGKHLFAYAHAKSSSVGSFSHNERSIQVPGTYSVGDAVGGLVAPTLDGAAVETVGACVGLGVGEGVGFIDGDAVGAAEQISVHPTSELHGALLSSRAMQVTVSSATM